MGKFYFKEKWLFIIMFQCIICNASTLFAQKEYLITNYGAKGDGITLNTIAIQKSIDAAFQNGGGRVVIPSGSFLSGGIELKDDVELYLSEDAILLGSTNISDYKRTRRWRALISADSQRNISITGKGTIDGQGLQLALNTDSLYHIGEYKCESYNDRRHRLNETDRPQVIEMLNCTNIKVSGVIIKDASCWVQTYSECNHLEISHVTVDSDAYWNNDGMDIEDSKDVLITNCNVNAADDGICLKSENSKSYCDNIRIINCKVRSSASAIKFGTSSHGGFKNVTIDSIKVYDTFRSAIAIESVDGGLIENINVSNVEATNTANAIFIRLGHRNGDKPGTVKNISIKNLTAQIPFKRPDIDYKLRGPEVDFFHNPFPASIAGIPGNYIENVTIENVEINYPGNANKGLAYMPLFRLQDVPEQIDEYPEFSMFGELPSWGFYVRHVKGITMKNIRLSLDKEDFRPAFVFDDVENINLEGIEIPDENRKQVILKNTKGVRLESSLLKFKKDL